MLARLLASKLALGVAGVASGAVLLGGVAFGALGGASPFGTPANVAPQLGAAPLAEDGKGTRGGKLAEILDKLVQNGTITADQRDKILAAIREATARPQAHRVDLLKGLLEDVAKIAGLSADDLKRELPGHSLAQVAQSHGVSRDTLVQTLTDDVNATIDQALADNRITVDQAGTLKAKASDTVATFVDRTVPDRTSRQRVAILHDLVADAAKAIGIDPAQLRKELPGKSVAQVAQDHGVSRDTLDGT